MLTLLPLDLLLQIIAFINPSTLVELCRVNRFLYVLLHRDDVWIRYLVSRVGSQRNLRLRIAQAVAPYTLKIEEGSRESYRDYLDMDRLRGGMIGIYIFNHLMECLHQPKISWAVIYPDGGYPSRVEKDRLIWSHLIPGYDYTQTYHFDQCLTRFLDQGEKVELVILTDYPQINCRRAYLVKPNPTIRLGIREILTSLGITNLTFQVLVSDKHKLQA